MKKMLIRLPARTKARLDRLRRTEGRTLNWLVVNAVEQALDAQPKTAKKARP